MAHASIAIRPGKMFGKGVAYARKHGGEYDARFQQWVLYITPSVDRMLNAPGAYGWQLIHRTDAADAIADFVADSSHA